MTTHPAPSARPATVLVVDDSPDIVFVIEHVLRAAGHDVLAAHSVTEGLQAIDAATAIDVALCDLRLPDGDGTALVRAVQARFPEAPSFLLTGMGLTPDEMPDGVAVLRKPVGIDDLERAVAQALAGRRR